MSKEKSEQPFVETSAQILLAEHQRLSTLYLHNVDMGEKRATAHMTLVSIGLGLLAGLTKVADSEFVLWTSLGLVIGVFLFGLVTFQRLIERRIRAIEYLRAINRIHWFFVLNDPYIKNYFYWPASDEVPTFSARATQLTGLRDIVAGFNSLFAGIATAEMLRITRHNPTGYPWAVGLGLIVTIAVGKLHLVYEKHTLGKIEKDAAKKVQFPNQVSNPK